MGQAIVIRVPSMKSTSVVRVSCHPRRPSAMTRPDIFHLHRKHARVSRSAASLRLVGQQKPRRSVNTIEIEIEIESESESANLRMAVGMAGVRVAECWPGC